MKKTILLLAGVLLLAACSPNREKQLKAIEEREAALSTYDMITEDDELTDIISLYRTFANDFPNDSLAPVFLQRAADLSIALGQTDQAVALLDTVINLYPGFEDLGGCWFLKGHAYETAEEYDSARATYSYFVENYPDHPLAKDTRFQLENEMIGMSPEDMLKLILGESE
ncbi:MAG: tetratricopeptide repeat protein [Bacteroidales bacterium]|nr:tetratricopeptide repeat protein [Bacteroidales bacterium]